MQINAQQDVASPISPNPLANVGPVWIWLLIATAVLLTFAGICRHEFLLWDDPATIEMNPRIQHPSAQNLMYIWTHPQDDLYVPVTYTVWSILAAFAQVTGPGMTPGMLNPAWFHAASVLLHLLNALLVYGLLRRLVGRQWPAAAGALLFALHPVQVETVAWASGLKDLLATTFMLAALDQYLRAIVQEGDDATAAVKRRRLHYAAGMAAMLLGMLAKPSAVTTPLLAMVLDLLVLRRPPRKVFAAIAPWFALVVPCLIWTKLFQLAGHLPMVPLWIRPLIATDALAFYLGKLIFPAHLTFDYGRAPWTAISNGWIYYTWLIPAGLAAALFAFARRSAIPAAGALLLVAALAPVLGLSTFDFQTISTVADHYLYPAMLGPALAAAWVLASVRVRHWPAFIAAVALGLLSARSIDQAKAWTDNSAFFAHGIRSNPGSCESYFGLAWETHVEGEVLAESGDAAAESKFVEAKTLCQQALQINPAHVPAWHRLGLILMDLKQYPEAADAFAQVIQRRDALAPHVRLALLADTDLLGQALLKSGRPQAAARQFRAALQLQPVPAGAQEHLRLAEAAIAQGDSTLDRKDHGAEPAIGSVQE